MMVYVLSCGGDGIGIELVVVPGIVSLTVISGISSIYERLLLLTTQA